MVREIEPKIKKLVGLLNDVPYIESYSSCEGHFGELSDFEEWDKPQVWELNRPAHVMWEMPKNKEVEFEPIAYDILSGTYHLLEKMIVSINKRFYVFNDDTDLIHRWELWIKPFEFAEYSAQLKRQYTDQAINLIEKILEQR